MGEVVYPQAANKAIYSHSLAHSSPQKDGGKRIGGVKVRKVVGWDMYSSIMVVEFDNIFYIMIFYITI